jgi:hypothetical protein
MPALTFPLLTAGHAVILLPATLTLEEWAWVDALVRVYLDARDAHARLADVDAGR